MRCCAPPENRTRQESTQVGNRIPFSQHAATQPLPKDYDNADCTALAAEEKSQLNGHIADKVCCSNGKLGSSHALHEAIVRDVSEITAKLLHEGLSETRAILCSDFQGMLDELTRQGSLHHSTTAFSANTFAESRNTPDDIVKQDSRMTAFFGSDPGRVPSSESGHPSSVDMDGRPEDGWLEAVEDGFPAAQAGALRWHTKPTVLHAEAKSVAFATSQPLRNTAISEGVEITGLLGADAGFERVLQGYRRQSVTGSASLAPVKEWFRKKDSSAGRRLKVDAIWDFSMIRKAREALDVKEYDVVAFYKDHGWAQRIARSDLFNNLVMIMVVVNAAYIGVEAQYNIDTSPEAIETQWRVSEHFFCTFFILEVLIRFLAFKQKNHCLRDGWFRLDLALAIIGGLEVWVVPIALNLANNGASTPQGSDALRLVRLLRLARSVRLFHFLPELLTMLKGMQVAGRAVASSLVLLALLVYTFSVMLYLGFGEQDLTRDFLGTLPLCMQTLFIRGILMDEIAPLAEALLGLEPLSATVSFVIFLVFTLISSMTVMNMLIGILVEVVSAVAQGEKEEATIRLMKKSLLVILVRLDTDGNGEIGQDEFVDMLRDPQAVEVLEELKVDIPYLYEMHERFYQKAGRQLPIAFIMNLILDCRGDYPAKVKDVVEGHAFTRWVTISTMERIEVRILEMLQRVHEDLLSYQSAVNDYQAEGRRSRRKERERVLLPNPRSSRGRSTTGSSSDQ